MICAGPEGRLLEEVAPEAARDGKYTETKAPRGAREDGELRILRVTPEGEYLCARFPRRIGA